MGDPVEINEIKVPPAVALTREEIAVLARVLSAIDIVLTAQDLELTEDEDQAFISARTKIVRLVQLAPNSGAS
jgi:hypothetical protein